MMIDFPKADPVERGCGEREQGGVYAETGLSRYGTPLEYFLIDPPQPLPVGLDLINKPQLWEDPATGITHLLIWIGGEHYEWCPDYVEECLPPDALIATARGLLPIRDVCEGDQVLTHLGHLRAVTNSMARPYTGTLVSIKTPYWHIPLRLTPEHPVLRAHVIRGRKRRKLEGIDGEHITERAFVPAHELQVGDYLCYPIHRDEIDVETVTMTYVKVYKLEHGNSTRTPERIAQAQALRSTKPSVSLQYTLRQLLQRLANRQRWTLNEVRETCSQLYRYDSGLVAALTQLCNKELLLRVERACYVVTDIGRQVAAEPFMTFDQLARRLSTSRTGAGRLVHPPNRQHIKHVKVPVTIDLMRLIGYYLAEGSVANTTQNGKEGYYNVVELSFGLKADMDEQGLAEDVCLAAKALGFGALVSTKRGYWHVVINSRHLAHWLIEEFGSDAARKSIPPWVIALPAVKLRPLIDAYIAGDGYVRGYQRCGTTVSLQLAYAVAQIANRIGWRASVTMYEQAENSFGGQAQTTNQQPIKRKIYRVICYERIGTHVFSDGEYLYLPILSITHNDYTGTVYNLTVENDESYCVGYHAVHNCRRFGASRRINPNLDLSRLTRESRMILAHPRAMNTLWQEQTPPQECLKHITRHDITSLALLNNDLQQKAGPCLFKVWEVIPQDAATEVLELEGESPICLRKIGSTIYQYWPTGESAEGLQPGLFAALPITGFALIKYDDGSVNESAKEKLQQAGLNFYETDR